jgi:hypothetical protein
MKAALAITSGMQLCLWGLTLWIMACERLDAWETLNVAAMIIAAMVTLTLALVAGFPRWLGILGAIAHVAAILTYFVPGLVIGGECLEGMALMFGYGLFIPYFVPAAVSAVLVLSLSLRHSG